MKKITLLLIALTLGLLAGQAALAHQPRLVTLNQPIIVDSPEISQAFYGELKGEPAIYVIRSTKSFKLYLNLLTPDIAGARQDFSAQVDYEDSTKEKKKLLFLDGQNTPWDYLYEKYGGDGYFKGPEVRADAYAGTYTIKVFNPDNQGKYVLAVGETESFPLTEMIKTLILLPRLKTDFFGKPWWTFLFNQIGIYILYLLVIIAVVIAIAIYVVKKIKRKKKGLTETEPSEKQT
jgi:hypothetical protein